MPAVTRFKIEKRQHVAMDRAEETVMRIGRGYQLSQALYVAAKLGVADVLGSEPLAAEAIAEAVDVRAPELRRVLRALVAAGVFTELADGRFATNDAAEALRADAPGRMRDVVINFGEEMYRAFGDLLHTVRTGETASDVLRDTRTLVDVGGGTGTLLAEVLSHRPTVGGVLLERPGMLELAHGYLADHGVADSSAASPSCRAAGPRWIEPRGWRSSSCSCRST